MEATLRSLKFTPGDERDSISRPGVALVFLVAGLMREARVSWQARLVATGKMQDHVGKSAFPTGTTTQSSCAYLPAIIILSAAASRLKPMKQRRRNHRLVPGFS